VAPERNGLLLEWPEAAALGARVAVTTRGGGVSAGAYESLNLGLHVGDDPTRVLVNRERAAAAFGANLSDLVFAQQVHGVNVGVVGPAEAGRVTRESTDAVAATDTLVTTTSGLILVILVADCVPIALIDPVARVLAAVHAGWRGTAAGAVARALDAMAAAGASPSRVVACIGPAVGPERYQVDEPVHRGLVQACAPEPLDPGVAVADGPRHWRVDLPAANRQQLRLAGVPEPHILDCGVTTADDDFFSDRAARPCGRFGLLAQLTGPGP
jgi:YfiH family protein